MIRLRRVLPSCVVLLVAVVLGGCARSNIVQVTGVLTYKGTPVTNAYLEFRPEHGRQSWAETDSQGRFKINYDAHQDGAVVGKHKVWIERRPKTIAEKEADLIHGHGSGRAKDRNLDEFFHKYGPDKSTLYVEITYDTKELPLNLD